MIRLALLKNTIIAVLCCLLVSSCIGGGSYNQVKQEDLRTGTQGIDIQFYDDLVDQGVRQNSLFSLTFELRNQGAYDVERGYVTVETEEPYVFIEGNKQKTFSMHGKSPISPDGEFRDISFRAASGKLDPSSQQHDTIIFATLCYDYQTKLTTDVCIDTDPYGRRVQTDQKICTGSDVSPGSQGSPIVVEKIEVREYVSSENYYLPEFVIHIRNARKGLPFKYDQVQTICSSNNIREDSLNQIFLYAKLSEEVLACDKPIFNLINGKAQVVCGLQPGAAFDPTIGSYKAPLYIELNYGYSETISETFKITKN